MKFYSFFYGDVNLKQFEDKISHIMKYIVSDFIYRYFIFKSSSQFVNKDGHKHFIISADMSKHFTAKDGFISSSLISYRLNTLKNIDWSDHLLNSKLSEFAKEFKHVEINIDERFFPYLNMFSNLYTENFNVLVIDRNLDNFKDRVIDMNLHKNNLQLDRVYNSFNFVKQPFINFDDFCQENGIKTLNITN